MKNSELRSPPAENLKLQHKKLDHGILGRFFGGINNAKIYISGLVVIMLVLGGIFSNNPKDYWGLSVITLIFGYWFGRRDSEKQ